MGERRSCRARDGGAKIMATFTVTTAADVVANDGQLSLREAVAQANATNAPDTINFAAPLEGRCS